MPSGIKNTLLLLSLSGLTLPFCLAQYQSLRFDRLTIEDGLPNPSVLDLLRDRQGFLWIGTLSGIVRYDGYEMKQYFPAAEHRDSLPERDIPKFYQDKAGNIWLTLTYQKAKLFRYEARTDRFIPYLFNPGIEKQAINKPAVTCYEDKTGRLLVGTVDEGLFAIEIQKEKEGISPARLPFKNFRHLPGDAHSIANNAVSKMTEDAKGNIWVATEGGLCKFIPGIDRFETFLFSRDTVPFANEFYEVFLEEPATLWVGTAIHGLLKFDLKTETFLRQFKHDPGNPFSIASNWVGKITGDEDGKFWIGAFGSMDIFDPDSGKFIHVKDESHAGWSEVFQWNNSLVVDYSGNIWAATWQTGIYKYNPGKGRFHFLRPNRSNKLDEAEILAVCDDRRGNIWLGSTTGLVRWDRKNGTFQRYAHEAGNPNSLSDNRVSSIVEDPDGYLWLGTNKGLDRLDPRTGTIRRFQPYGQSDLRVWKSKKGEIWVTNWQNPPCRLLDKDKGIFKCYLDQPGLNYGIVAFEEDESGNIWLGINQNGMYRLDPKTEQFELLIPEYGVHDIHFDKHGNCWLATHSGGLKLFDRKTRQVVHLPEDVQAQIGIARGIREDAHGFLWMKTQGGIVKFDPQSRLVVRRFSTLNWMKKGAQWYGGGGYAAGNGELFFTSPGGVLHFHPDSLLTDTFPPKVALTEFRLFNETVQPGARSPLKRDISQAQEIVLAHWQNDFTLVFAALHFKSPAENTCQFMLENYDRAWRSSGSERTANYTNLSPGKYIFKVKAANGDEVWGKPVSLQIIIRPPWWASWWARLGWVALAIGSLLFIRRYEMRRQSARAEARRLQELDAVKSRLYTNITHEFRTPLTVILGIADQLDSSGGLQPADPADPANPGGLKPAATIRRNSRQLLHLVNQMLDLSKLESGAMKLHLVQGDVVNYLRYLAESFHSLAKSKDIRLHFLTELPELIMDYEPQRLQQVVSNLLSNAFKFTPAGGDVFFNVSAVGASSAKRTLQLIISDTGSGIPAEKLPFVFDRFYQADDTPTRQSEGTGIGLSLAKELVKLMNGDLSVSSVAGCGAAFTVALPIVQTAEKQALVPGFSGQGLPEEAFFEEGESVFPMPVPQTKDPHASLILLIEDNADVVKYLLTCLPDYRIEVAQDGEKGIEKALDLVPDLILSDVMMPKKDGFEVCQILKNDERTSHVPIILLTAKAEVESKLAGLERGADAYLPKPFHKEELLVRIRKLLELRQKLQAHYFALATGSQGADLTNMPNLDTAPAEDAFVLKLRGIIESRLDDAGFSVEQLCREAAMSRANLFRKLKALTGQSAGDLVRSIRLAKAKQLLREDPSLTIAAVAYDTGFSDPDYFAKVFKEEVGRTPSEWRKT